MPRFCTRCGARADDAARFCAACGAPLPQASPAAAGPQDSHVASRPGAEQRGLLVAAGAVVGLALAGIAVWLLFGAGGAGPSRAQLQAAAGQWLGTHQQELMQDACLRDLNYAANPMLIDPDDRSAQRWLAVLVESGVYAQPQRVENFLGEQWSYAWGPQASRYIRQGELCVAGGIALSGAHLLRAGSAEFGPVPPGVTIPPDWAFAALDLRWTNLAPWSAQPEVQRRLPRLASDLQQRIILRRTAQGAWVLPSPAEELGMQMQWRSLMAGAAVGEAARRFGQRLGEALGGGQMAPSAPPSSASAQSGGWWGWLKNPFRGNAPAASAPQ